MSIGSVHKQRICPVPKTVDISTQYVQFENPTYHVEIFCFLNKLDFNSP